jgi:hypothetical protein
MDAVRGVGIRFAHWRLGVVLLAISMAVVAVESGSGPAYAGVALVSGQAGNLAGVSAYSATDAWVVGSTGNGFFPPSETTTAHWNGTSWSQVASPNPAGSAGENSLESVSDLSPNTAWAVGYDFDSATDSQLTLVLFWNGTTWTQQSTPNPGGTSSGESFLYGVTAVSPSDAWAVGEYLDSTTGDVDSLVLHWNGTVWTQVASPNPATSGNTLSAVTGISATDAWAVGTYTNAATDASETFVVHWNGHSWSQVPSPNPAGVTTYGSQSVLNSVSAISPSDIESVGWYQTSPTSAPAETLALRWNGHQWDQMPTPNPGGTTSDSDASHLFGVSIVSATDAWAVGAYTNPKTEAVQTLTLRWNGKAWDQTASPNPGGTKSQGDVGQLFGVSTVSAKDAWAIGDYGGQPETLLLHWNGSNWSKA